MQPISFMVLDRIQLIKPCWEEYLDVVSRSSPFHTYVKEHGIEFVGEAVAVPTRVHRMGEWVNHEIILDANFDEEATNRIASLVMGISPAPKKCFFNALGFWYLAAQGSDSVGWEVGYVEGFASFPGDPIPVEHAWNTIDGRIIDTTTTEFSSYLGVPLDDEELLGHYYEQCMETGTWGVIGNRRSDWEFLRERGYFS
jgi:hypothetical protein